MFFFERKVNPDSNCNICKLKVSKVTFLLRGSRHPVVNHLNPNPNLTYVLIRHQPLPVGMPHKLGLSQMSKCNIIGEGVGGGMDHVSRDRKLNDIRHS